MPDPSPLFSIIIPTYNRVRHLQTALESVLTQDFDPANYEVIVVDSLSTDGTHDLVRTMQTDHEHLKFVQEEKLGLSLARNRGWAHAKGLYAGFMDDDCRAPRDWLAAAAGIAARVSPDAFGGPFYPFYDGQKPVWWKDEYRTTRLLPQARMLNDGEYLAGGNLFVRASVLEAVGGFSPDFGPAGSKMGYGDETELLVRMRTHGAPSTIYYDPDLYVHHLVHAERMTLSWAARFNFSSGRSYRAYRQAIPRKSLQRVIRLVLNLFREFGIMAVRAPMVMFRDRARYPHWKNYFYEVVVRRTFYIGRTLEQLVE